LKVRTGIPERHQSKDPDLRSLAGEQGRLLSERHPLGSPSAAWQMTEQFFRAMQVLILQGRDKVRNGEKLTDDTRCDWTASRLVQS
jgi:flagellar biosynthesis chaperone FliJ